MTRKLFALLMLAATLLPATGRVPDYCIDELNRHIEQVTADAKATAANGSIDDLFAFGYEYCWHNGVSLYKVSVDDNTLTFTSHKDPGVSYRIKRVGANTLRVDGMKGYTARYRKIGHWNLLVINNSANCAVDVLIGEDELRDPRVLTFETHDLIDGVYANAQGELYCFGKPAYSTAENEKLADAAPGVYQASPGEYFENPWSDNRIYFADGRMKYVPEPDAKRTVDQAGVTHYFVDGHEVSEHEYYNVMAPGHGGHGALLGPVEWQWSLTEHGMHIKRLTTDDNWRDYSPYTNEVEFDLTKVKGSFDAICPGLWGVASMRPLTAAMLRQLTAADLKLMQREIQARYGVRFADKAAQAYFNRQPWYKSKGLSSHRLTAIEALNTELIKSIENHKR